MSGGASADTKKSPMEVAMQNSPSTFFHNALGRPVVVRLVTGADYHGILALVDGYMNIALEQTEEYVGDQLKARYGDAFIRGNNGLFLSCFSSFFHSSSSSPFLCYPFFQQFFISVQQRQRCEKKGRIKKE